MYFNYTLLIYECQQENIHFCFTFNEDNTYEYSVTSNNQIVSTEYGTYSIDNNKVVCTSEENITTTFFNTDFGVLCVEYSKE